MPGGGAGFRKQWGYYQFAQVIEDEVRAMLRAALPKSIEAQPAAPAAPEGGSA
jgi:hypothetical protein